MRLFVNFVSKEFKHIFRDRMTLIVLFGIPVIQLLIFGYVITNDFKDIGIAVYDQSNDLHTSRITNKVFSSGYFINSGQIHSDQQIEEQFKSGSVRAVLVFPADFSNDLENENYAEIQIITDASDPNLAKTIVGYLSGIIQQYQIQELSMVVGSMGAQPEIRMSFNEELEGPYMFIPGTMALILMIIGSLLTSVSVAREKELGTMEVLLVSPLKPSLIILGKVTPYIILSSINALVILLMGILVFGLPVVGSLGLLMFELLLFILLSLSLGIFISTMAP
ncbi:MAG: ABC transporter permease, partial [Bacteroidales bacterium]|nr:ABC transporter permease [Bacteroidales bacterium]